MPQVSFVFCKPLLFHGGDTGSIPVRDAKFRSIFEIGFSNDWPMLALNGRARAVLDSHTDHYRNNNWRFAFQAANVAAVLRR